MFQIGVPEPGTISLVLNDPSSYMTCMAYDLRIGHKIKVGCNI